MNGVNGEMHCLHKDTKQSMQTGEPQFQHLRNAPLSWKGENWTYKGIFLTFQSIKTQEKTRRRVLQIKCQSTARTAPYLLVWLLIWSLPE